MKRFAQQFRKQSDKIRLSAEEQFLLREKVTTFMEYHPLPAVAGEPQTILSLDTVFKTTKVSWKKMSASFGLVAIAFIVTLPAAAEYTVPGDMLYPVKVKINEEVRSTLARTPYEKVEWEAERIERRISEARVLAKAGLLTPEAEEAVAVAVSQHRTNANAEIALLRESNNTDEVALANMTLASIFEVQSTAFAVNDTASLTIATSATPTAIAPRTIASVLEGGRAELAILNESGDISHGRLMAEIEKQTTRAYERLESIKEAVSQPDIADINRRLEDISIRINEAKEKSPEEGSDELRQALKDTQKLIAFMNDIDLRSSIAVERIVPITPTFDERMSVFTPNLEEFVAEIEKIERVVVEQFSESNSKEEFLQEIDRMKQYIEKATSANPKTIKDIEVGLIEMRENAETVTMKIIEAGGDFEADVELEAVDNSSTSTPTSSSEIAQ